MTVMALRRKPQIVRPVNPALEAFLQGYSIEVMPRTAAKVEDFRALLSEGTRVYIAHLNGTPIEDMVATAKRLASDGYQVMPHFPARFITDKAMLADWIDRYRSEAGVTQALLLAGGANRAQGDFEDSMQLLQTGLFERAGFTHLHVAGHPEGNKDIDPDGGRARVMQALRWKQDYARQSAAKMAIVTQFCFEAGPVIDWGDDLKAEGIELPIHIGVAGPAKLQTMIKFSIACGIGPSLRVLRRRAKDVTKLLVPFTPDEFLGALAAHKASHPDFNVSKVHFFPLGGIKTNATWAMEHGGSSAAPAAASQKDI
jgi:methylenetetrahydrofolate reductase (NADH)